MVDDKGATDVRMTIFSAVSKGFDERDGGAGLRCPSGEEVPSKRSKVSMEEAAVFCHSRDSSQSEEQEEAGLEEYAGLEKGLRAPKGAKRFCGGGGFRRGQLW